MLTLSASFSQAIVQWDGVAINGGQVGPVAKALEALLWSDMKGTAQAELDQCTVPTDPTVIANHAVASNPTRAGAQHVTEIPVIARL